MWIWCLIKATHEEYDTLAGLQNVHLEIEQFVFGRKKASIELGMPESSIYRFIKKLETEKMLSIKTNNKVTQTRTKEHKNIYKYS